MSDFIKQQNSLMHFNRLKAATFSMAIMSLAILLLTAAACKSGGNKSAEDDVHSVLNKVPIKTLTEQINKYPNDATKYFARGNALHSIQEDSLALNDYQKAVSLDSSQARYFSAIGDLLFEHKDITGSVSWIERALQRDPTDVRANLKLAKMMVIMQQYPKALAEVNTVLRIDVYNPEAYFLKALAYREMRDTAKAISNFLTCINVAPDYKEAMIQLGQIYNTQGNPLGMKYLDNAFKVDTTDVFPLYAKAMWYQEKGDFEAAKAEYRNCISHDPRYSNAVFNLGYIYLEQDSAKKAYSQFDIITKNEPNNAKAYYGRGISNKKMGNLAAAKNDFEQALVFNKDLKVAQEELTKLGK